MSWGIGWKKPKYLERRQRTRKNLPTVHLTRASAQLQNVATGEVLNGRIFLHDLTQNGVGIFLSAPLGKDQEVFLVLEKPRHFFIRGRIAWCTLYRLNTRVISAENFQYRAGIRFEFDSPADRELVARYFSELASPAS